MARGLQRGTGPGEHRGRGRGSMFELLPSTNAISAHGAGVAVIVMLSWPALLMSLGTYAERLHGTGATEYRRVGVGGVIEIAVAGFAARFPRSRR